MMTARFGALARAAAATLLTLAAFSAPVPTAVAAQVPEPPAREIPVFRDGRPFRHAEHRAVTCGDCHRPDERHRSRRSWTSRDCQACHHGRNTPAGCTRCHERGTFEEPRHTATRMHLSVWLEPRDRDLLFEHDRHAAVGCLDCHRGGMRVRAEHCSTCHLDHHRPEAECARCHEAPNPTFHERAAHLSCGGGGCHSAAALERPMTSRQFCLVCHAEQGEHRPGRACLVCHVKPTPPTQQPERSDHGHL